MLTSSLYIGVRRLPDSCLPAPEPCRYRGIIGVKRSSGCSPAHWRHLDPLFLGVHLSLPAYYRWAHPVFVHTCGSGSLTACRLRDNGIMRVHFTPWTLKSFTGIPNSSVAASSVSRGAKCSIRFTDHVRLKPVDYRFWRIRHVPDMVPSES